MSDELVEAEGHGIAFRHEKRLPFQSTSNCRSTRASRQRAPSSSGVMATGAIDQLGFACPQPKPDFISTGKSLRSNQSQICTISRI